MAGKRVQHDDLIAFYDRLNRSRALLPHESERLADIVRRKALVEAQRKYREKNRERLNAKKRSWYESNRERALATSKRYQQANPHVVRAACRRWRTKQDRLNTECAAGLTSLKD